MHGNGTTGWRRCGAALLALGLVCPAISGTPPAQPPPPVLLVVMDPLAKELACACVKGYGQRDYRKLATRFESVLKQHVSIEFSDDLAESLKNAGAEREIIIVGDRALTAHGAQQAGLKAHPLCALTDLDGATDLPALFVARAEDPAKELKHLAGRKLILGIAQADVRHAAALAALRAAGVEGSPATEFRPTYTEAAVDVLDSVESPSPVAVVPGFALPLLVGCGSVKQGDLKVIGKTEASPFVTVFLSDSIAAGKEQKILRALLELKSNGRLLKALESRDGFKALKPPATDRPPAGAACDWPDWRGPGRDGHVPRLPERLPGSAKFIWKKAAMTGGLAGLSVGDGRLILAERDFADEHDVYRCLDADTGDVLWQVAFPARGKLDYGQFPRATPVIRAGRAFLLGALGGLRCVNLANGKVIWQRELPRTFKAPVPTWGFCSTPLLVDGLVVVNPGAPNASLTALDCKTGRTRWTTPGVPAAYASFICGDFGGRRQIVGYDKQSLGGWDLKSGARLWQLVPPAEGDFNVPTPIATEGGVLVATENNGTRLYRFDGAGRILSEPAAQFAALSPDTSTPVVAGGRVFGADGGVFCLDARANLKPVWQHEDNKLGDYATLLADDERVLVITLGGELILLDAGADDFRVLSRLKLFDEEVEVYSHPALVRSRLFVRGGESVGCVDLEAN